MTSSDLTLRTAQITAAFCAVADALYALAAIEPTPLAALFFTAAPLATVVLWLQKDARRTGVGIIQDWGFFVWMAWSVLIPWYVFKTRGMAGWRLTAGLFALIGSASLSWLATAWLAYGVRYAIWYLRFGH